MDYERCRGGIVIIARQAMTTNPGRDQRARWHTIEETTKPCMCDLINVQFHIRIIRI